METSEAQSEGSQPSDETTPVSQSPEQPFTLPIAESEEAAANAVQPEKDQRVVVHHHRRTRNNLLPTIVVGVLIFLIGGLTGFVSRPFVMPPPIPPTPTLSAAQQQQQTSMQEILTKLISKTRHFQGNANAPVTLLEFADFQ